MGVKHLLGRVGFGIFLVIQRKYGQVSLAPTGFFHSHSSHEKNTTTVCSFFVLALGIYLFLTPCGQLVYLTRPTSPSIEIHKKNPYPRDCFHCRRCAGFGIAGQFAIRLCDDGRTKEPRAATAAYTWVVPSFILPTGNRGCETSRPCHLRHDPR